MWCSRLSIKLMSDEIEHLLSLSESEQEEFFSTLTPQEIDQVVGQVEKFVSDETKGLPPGANFASDRSAKASEIINAKTAAAQEIGPLPPVADPVRRSRCSADNLLFAETYFAATFYLDWAPYQRSMMERFQAVVMDGGRECHAVRRGGLKSTAARAATIWAVLNGHRRFPVLVGATDKATKDHRKNFFDLMASSPTLLEDFPEIQPLLLKVRQPKRQFRLDGRLLEVHPKDDKGRIVFPDIHGAASCQSHVAPYSVNSTDVSGLSYVDRFGVTIRPDLLIFDDVQTPQSAKSPLMTEEREEMVTKTFCGLAGLGEKLAAIMVCTVREHDDLTERFLNRERHADWFGTKYPSVIKMPDRMDLWDLYGQKLGQGATPEEGKRIAQEFYVTNRAAMDAGGQVAWELDKLPDELSALQSLMTVRYLDPEFFRCEIQQDGAVPINTSGLKLDAKTLLTRLNLVERGVIPEQSDYLTAFVDSQDQVLYWMVVAWTKDFSGWIVDYGAFPDQKRSVYYKNDLTARISDLKPGASWEECFVLAHTMLDDQLFQQYPELDLVLKDWSDGQHKPRIESQIMASRNKSRLRPSKGFAPKPGRKPVHLWGDQHRDRHAGQHWVERRSETPVHVQFDANQWKSHTARRLLTTLGAPSAISLPGTDERANRMLAEHLTSEAPKQIIYDGTPGVVWELLPTRDNEFWDTLVGNCVAASMLGVGMAGEKVAKKELRTFQLPGGARRG
jgi:hypothetical protein